MALWNLLKKKTAPPELGQRVEITWLPNPVNNPREKSCYIGSVGTVRCVYEDGSFDLQYDSGGWLMVGSEHKYRAID
jgi:hypothetical protein